MRETRIIIELVNGHWLAWIDGKAADGTFGRSTAAEAGIRVLEANGIDPDLIEADYDRSRDERQVFRVRLAEPCPDCGGSGKYVGLSAVEDCGTCGGSGRVLE